MDIGENDSSVCAECCAMPLIFVHIDVSMWGANPYNRKRSKGNAMTRMKSNLASFAFFYLRHSDTAHGFDRKENF
ncbi:hypothetical protein [Agathobaculum sp. Marseille-P7918]|uniref:hypothetical protein n=1 Tax=Agathobaculum sp. Marseille-P7918 TaxID=2479843 RepID=UPI000F637834|nr:hypothetical protein [Agathobaculum sp. Marseille-P7918]